MNLLVHDCVIEDLGKPRPSFRFQRTRTSTQKELATGQVREAYAEPMIEAGVFSFGNLLSNRVIRDRPMQRCSTSVQTSDKDDSEVLLSSGRAFVRLPCSDPCPALFPGPDPLSMQGQGREKVGEHCIDPTFRDPAILSI